MKGDWIAGFRMPDLATMSDEEIEALAEEIGNRIAEAVKAADDVREVREIREHSLIEAANGAILRPRSADAVSESGPIVESVDLTVLGPRD